MIVVRTGFVTGVGSLAVSPCGGWLVAAPRWELDLEPPVGGEGEARGGFDPKFWKLPAPARKARVLPCPRPLGACFLPSGELIVHEAFTALKRQTFPSGSGSRTLFGNDEPHSFCVSPDGKHVLALIVTNRRYTIRLWDVAAEKEVKLGRTAFKHNSNQTMPLAFHPSCNRVAAVICNMVQLSRERLKHNLAVWEFPTGKLVRAVEFKKAIPDLATYSLDGSLLAGCDMNTLLIWDSETLKVLQRVRLVDDDRPSSSVPCPTFTRDGRFIAVGCVDGSIRFFDTRNWTEARVYEWGKVLVGEAERKQRLAMVTHIAFTPDGTMGVAAVGNDIVLWDLE